MRNFTPARIKCAAAESPYGPAPIMTTGQRATCSDRLVPAVDLYSETLPSPTLDTTENSFRLGETKVSLVVPNSEQDFENRVLNYPPVNDSTIATLFVGSCPVRIQNTSLSTL